MASDYQAIREDNIGRYGTDIWDYGPKLLSDLYAERTHFIHELLQNAEDALGRRKNWKGSRSVSFTLTPECLTQSHFGIPFNEGDVRSICSIAKSTKNQSSIGKFGIGFKSVYAFTELPQIHSGEENFAVKNYVHPEAIAPIERERDETLIVLPFKRDDPDALDEIVRGFNQLGPQVLLFLREIEDIRWRANEDSSGFYRRSEPEKLGDGVRLVNITGKISDQSDQTETEQSWLVFDGDALSDNRERIGRIEIAFRLEEDDDQPPGLRLSPLSRSHLAVFFPTIVETHLGFLIQGPYQTTPNRDNIKQEEQNRLLVGQTADLLASALLWLRDKDILNISALNCLPLDRNKFEEGSLFEPLFEAVRNAFLNESLLPRFGGGYISAEKTRLARTRDLRELVKPEQFRQLFDIKKGSWLTDEITETRTPGIYRYIIHELGINEITPENFIHYLNRNFLIIQSDKWIQELYIFLYMKLNLYNRIMSMPIIRLENGKHVSPKINGRPQAYLPGDTETNFPTVSSGVCNARDAIKFLVSVEINEPDLIDDIVSEILHKYQSNTIDIEDKQYSRDIDILLKAFNDDSIASPRKRKLIGQIQESYIIKAIDLKNGKRYMELPEKIYISNDRLKRLFSNISDILVIDESYPCLQSEGMTKLLEACGAVDYPRPVKTSNTNALPYEEKKNLRIATSGKERIGNYGHEEVTDWSLDGIEKLMDMMPSLTVSERIERARLLWESLIVLKEKYGEGCFKGDYKWTFHTLHHAKFPSFLVRLLNETAWIPGSDGGFHPPHAVDFESLEWVSDSFLEENIRFKPPIIKKLAEEAGIDPDVLNYIKEHEISLEEMESIRQKRNKYTHGKDTEYMEVNESGGNYDKPEKPEKSSRDTGQSRPSFISYIGVQHEEIHERRDDGGKYDRNMQIEKRAIDIILELEPNLNPTSANNPGFDLHESDEDGTQVRWVEVKSMTGSLEGGDAALSHTQFDFARQKGEAYWLYIVEYATDPHKTRLLRIQDPAGKASTYTFDKGWESVAEIVSPAEES